MHNLLNLFRRQKSRIELYCQNPDCRDPLIESGSRVALISEGCNNYITHSRGDCFIHFGDSSVLESGRMVSKVIEIVRYDEAVRLARQGEVRFTRLKRAANQQ